jgi:DNA polymerase V
MRLVYSHAADYLCILIYFTRMDNLQHYIAIDLKSFFASVECVERGLNPLTTNLVVADKSRTEKTICLAVTPSLKSYGIPGRPRLFEVVQRVREINNLRQQKCRLTGTSTSDTHLKSSPNLAVDYIVAPPRMAKYIEYSTRIYQIYLRYIAPEDIHVYSIDEVFIDATAYLSTYRMTARQLAIKMIREVLAETGITATAGIGTNMYLCKIAMDIVAKHMPADADGVRIAELDEMSYRKQLWNHQPLTDFWRVGRGIAKKLGDHGIFTMGQIARASLSHEDFLYKLFGVNAELLIDHAWGYEPCPMNLVKAYRPETNSLCSGQVLQSAYNFDKARVVVQEMTDGISLDLIDKGLVTDQLVLSIGYDIESLTNKDIRDRYHGEIAIDHYGRCVPRPAHGSANLPKQTSSSRIMCDAILALYDKLVNPILLIRRISITTNHVVREESVDKQPKTVQLDLFTDYELLKSQQEKEIAELARERRMQEAVLSIKKKFGKNSLLKGINYADGATAKERNKQIGGHKA